MQVTEQVCPATLQKLLTDRGRHLAPSSTKCQQWSGSGAA